jgi:hypothetical protein
MITSFFITVLLLLLLVQGSAAMRLSRAQGAGVRIPGPVSRLR